VRDFYKRSHISLHSLWNDATSWSWSELGEPSFRSSYTNGKRLENLLPIQSEIFLCWSFDIDFHSIYCLALWRGTDLFLWSILYICCICVSRANVLLRQHQSGVGKFNRGDTYCVWVFRLFASQRKWPTGLRTCFLCNSYFIIVLLFYARNSDEKKNTIYLITLF